MNKNLQRISPPTDYNLDSDFYMVIMDYAILKSGKMDLAMARTY